MFTLISDPDWPGDAKVAGWFLWGQCAWIGSGWCEWSRETPASGDSQDSQVSAPGKGIQGIKTYAIQKYTPTDTGSLDIHAYVVSRM